jgi:holo-[acyl-carrier protein] synthase
VSSPRPTAGCDVVDVERFSAVVDRREGFLDRVFTERERTDARRRGVTPGSAAERARLAARFAAKEATRKALGDLRLPFHAVEVRSDPDGAPRLYLHDEPSALAVSLSHDGGIAMAVVFGLLVEPAEAPDQTSPVPTSPVPTSPVR